MTDNLTLIFTMGYESGVPKLTLIEPPTSSPKLFLRLSAGFGRPELTKESQFPVSVRH